MNYEEKHKQAVQQMKDLLDRGKENGWLQLLAFENDFEMIFPEIKENEDEKIKKVLMDYFKRYQEYGGDTFDGISIATIIAWLEKQGEQKHTDKEVGNWTIQDAKDGDVLADKDVILIFRGIGNSERDDVIGYHCCYCYNRTAFMVQEDLDYWGHVWNNELRPATKNQRDLLFKKMKEAGYEWNADKKELRQTENKTQDPNDDETYADAINRGWVEFEGNGLSNLRPRDIYNVGFYDGYDFGKTKRK